MARLILHCGLHKTGTTTLQVTLRDSAEALRQQGVLYPRAGRLDQLGGGHHNLAWQIGEDRRFARKFGGIGDLAAEIAGFAGDVVLSSEDFENSLHRPERFRALLDLPGLAGRTAVFVIYLRDQVSYLESLYHQKLLHGFGESFADMLAEVRATRRVARHEWCYQFDYAAVAAGLRSLDGVQVVVRPTDSRQSDSLLTDFLALVAPGWAPPGTVEAPRVNARIPVPQALKRFIVNRQGRPLADSETAAINRLWSPSARYPARMPASAARALAALFAEGNRQLETAYGLPAGVLEAAPPSGPGGGVAIDALYSFQTQQAVSDLTVLLEQRTATPQNARGPLHRAIDTLVASTWRHWQFPAPPPAASRPAGPTPPVSEPATPPPRTHGNLIDAADHFGGPCWHSLPEAETEQAAAPAAPYEGCAVMAHRLRVATTAATGAIYRHATMPVLAPEATYAASLDVWIPQDFSGQLVGIVFDGFTAQRTVNADLGQRDCWQTVEVVAATPNGIASATPSLYVVGPQGSTVYSCCWRLEPGQEATPYRPMEFRTGRPQAGQLRLRAYSAEALESVRSPEFRMMPPQLVGVELIPPDPLRAMQRAWNKQVFAARDVVLRQHRNVVLSGIVSLTTAHGEPVAAPDQPRDAPSQAALRQTVRRAVESGHITTLAGPHVLCKRPGTENYGHWMLEMLPQAILARGRIADPQVRFVVPRAREPLAGAIAQSLARAGVPTDRIVYHDGQPVLFETLVTVEGLTSHGGFMSPLAVEATASIGLGVPPGVDRQLYVGRESAPWRQFADPGAVASLAESRGHVRFDPAGLDLRAQIAAFSGARRVVGIMGAALTNIVFMPPGGEVVVLAPAGMPDTFFWFLAGLKGLRYTEIRCRSVGPSPSPTPYDGPMEFPEAEAGRIFPPG